MVVVVACKDECVTNLSPNCKHWLANMGSSEVWNLEYRQGFAFVGVSGRFQAAEKKAESKFDQVTVTQIFQINVDDAAHQVA